MDILTCPVQHSAWGSIDAIPSLLGTPVDGRPHAELWMGAHERGPATLERDGVTRTLDEVIAANPVAELGSTVAGRYGALPYLFKVLAAQRPLSLQMHPNPEQARAGYAAEDAAQVPVDAFHRSFRDRNHKPEMICAVTRFEGLCGFRDPKVTRSLLDRFALDELDPVSEALRRPDPERALRAALAWTVTQPEAEAAELAHLVAGRAAEITDPGPFVDEIRWAGLIGDYYPGDLGIVTALLLNYVDLAPGEALFLGAGNLHAYLRGTAVEVMANSDNVVRGGLTPKHIDVPVLLELVDSNPTAAPVQRAADAVHHYDAAVDEFSLTRVRGETAVERRLAGPEIILVVGGTATVDVAGDPEALSRGQIAWIPASDGRYGLSTDAAAEVYVAAVARS